MPDQLTYNRSRKRSAHDTENYSGRKDIQNVQRFSQITEHIPQFKTMWTFEQFYNILSDSSTKIQEAVRYYLEV